MSEESFGGAWSASGGLPSGTGGITSTPSQSPSACAGAGLFDARPGRTYALAYSKDGALLAVGSQSQEPNLRVFRASDDGLLMELAGHQRSTYGVAFSPDGSLLASAGEVDGVIDANTTGVVKVWRVSDGTMLHDLPARTGFYSSSVEFSHDGKLLATSGAAGYVELWGVPNFELVRSIPLAQTTYTARFSPDDSLLVTSGTGQEANVWRVADGSLVSTLVGHTYSVSDAMFSPDGSQIATAGYDNTARIWDTTTGKELQVLRQNIELRYLSKALWYDPTHLLTNDWNGGLRSWVRSLDGTFVLDCERYLGGQSLAIAISPDLTELRAAGTSASEGVWQFR